MRRLRGVAVALGVVVSGGLAQAGLVINEVSIGTDPGEFVELLVTADGDYTGYTVIDGGSFVGMGGYQFTGAGFASLRAGTIIVLWTGNNGDDSNTVTDYSYDPDGGDWVLQFNRLSPASGSFAVAVDAGMNLGSVDECILIGRGPAYAISAGQFTQRTKAAAATSYCDAGQFHFGVSRNLYTDMTTLDIDLQTSLDIRATGGSWAAEADYEQGLAPPDFTPGAPNTPANHFAMLVLRGLAPDDPKLVVTSGTVVLGPVAPAAPVAAQLSLLNDAVFNALTVAGSTISGVDAGDFSITAEPAAIDPGDTAMLGLSFVRASDGFSSATLTVVSNDAAGDQPTVQLWGFAASMGPLSGVYISEVQAGPEVDSFIEVVNTSASAADLTGVLVTDEETAQGEGALRFPAGTMIAPGEVILLAVGTVAGEPSWLGALATTSACTRLFVEPARDSSGWTLPGAVTLTVLEDAAGLTGTAGAVVLASADGVALQHRAAILSADGIVAAALTIDGVNWDGSSTEPSVPISALGAFDAQSDRAGAGPLADGSSLVRIAPAAANSASALSFTVSGSPTPGTWNGLANVCASVADWME